MPSAARCSPSVGLRRQLPRKRWRLLVCFTGSQIKPALKGEVNASKASRRRGYIGAALVYVNPSVNPPCGVLPAPRPGSLLVQHSFIYEHGDGFPSPHLHNLLRSPAARRISHGGAIFHIAQAIFHCALAQFHCGRKPAYIVPVTTTVVTPGVTLTTPVVVFCVNVAAGTVSVVAAPVSGRVSTPAV